ncbi:hypothetical protein EDEG_00284 [Edhazardia aedis USNM 41457]|uniref:Uncharacterized protein n=1 Tax=Edhazardia aedis (strain USNM 41457) TaxID=1003232 RepID=J8ZRV7_EDHAE|nr:hypothetical protein EDEG_00284 [Edhazardia aedis USNM 41457]|eukprot:EJW02428.1 hypothetical protein EDEG_00284 [Edhazardia aedis USNM 41457]
MLNPIIEKEQKSKEFPSHEIKEENEENVEKRENMINPHQSIYKKNVDLLEIRRNNDIGKHAHPEKTRFIKDYMHSKRRKMPSEILKTNSPEKNKILKENIVPQMIKKNITESSELPNDDLNNTENNSTYEVNPENISKLNSAQKNTDSSNSYPIQNPEKDANMQKTLVDTTPPAQFSNPIRKNNIVYNINLPSFTHDNPFNTPIPSKNTPQNIVLADGTHDIQENYVNNGIPYNLDENLNAYNASAGISDHRIDKINLLPTSDPENVEHKHYKTEPYTRVLLGDNEKHQNNTQYNLQHTITPNSTKDLHTAKKIHNSTNKHSMTHNNTDLRKTENISDIQFQKNYQSAKNPQKTLKTETQIQSYPDTIINDDVDNLYTNQKLKTSETARNIHLHPNKIKHDVSVINPTDAESTQSNQYQHVRSNNSHKNIDSTRYLHDKELNHNIKLARNAKRDISLIQHEPITTEKDDIDHVDDSTTEINQVN